MLTGLFAADLAIKTNVMDEEPAPPGSVSLSFAIPLTAIEGVCCKRRSSPASRCVKTISWKNALAANGARACQALRRHKYAEIGTPHGLQRLFSLLAQARVVQIAGSARQRQLEGQRARALLLRGPHPTVRKAIRH